MSSSDITADLRRVLDLDLGRNFVSVPWAHNGNFDLDKNKSMSPQNKVRKIRLGHLKSDRFAKLAHARQPQLKYNGGPLLQHVEVFTIFWGSVWQKQPALISLAHNINDFFSFILVSPLIDHLAEYNVPARSLSIGHGKLTGTTTLATEPGPLIDDSDIQAMLKHWIATEAGFPRPNANTLYFIYFPPGTSITLEGDSSCEKFGGYHDAIDDKIFYAVEPFCLSSGGNLSQLDFFTLTSSHELCEAITDPIPGAGWYWFRDKEHQGEIGDICEAAPNAEERMGSFLVQREWSNAKTRCV